MGIEKFDTIEQVQKDVKEKGTVINTEVQEEGTTVVLNQVLKHNKKFSKPEDIMNDDKAVQLAREIYKSHKDLFDFV